MIVRIGLVAWVIMVVGAVVAGMLVFPHFTMLRRPACMGTAVLPVALQIDASNPWDIRINIHDFFLDQSHGID